MWTVQRNKLGDELKRALVEQSVLHETLDSKEAELYDVKNMYAIAQQEWEKQEVDMLSTRYDKLISSMYTALLFFMILIL